VPYLLGELANHLTTVRLAVDDMVRLANDPNLVMSLDVANVILARKTIASPTCAGDRRDSSGGGGRHRPEAPQA
jgi:hypothetical protein